MMSCGECIPIATAESDFLGWTQRESSDPNGFLSRTLAFVSTTRGLLYKPTSNPQRWDVVLLGASVVLHSTDSGTEASEGGLMGSVFS